jgi:hypothetical protein
MADNGATEAVPSYIPVVSLYSPTSVVKPATPDLIVFDQAAVPIEYMTDLIFENVGGQEMISITRNDLVNGQKVLYSPIKNLSELGLKYNSKNIFTVPSTSESFFKNFSIKLENHVPTFGVGTGHLLFPTTTDATLKDLRESIYIEYATDDEPDFPSDENLIVNVVGMSSNNLVEIQVLSAGNTFGDIMYVDGTP